jgi:hypothetical protein
MALKQVAKLLTVTVTRGAVNTTVYKPYLFLKLWYFFNVDLKYFVGTFIVHLHARFHTPEHNHNNII